MKGYSKFAALFAFGLLAGCASSPITFSSKQVNASVMQDTLQVDGSLSPSFKARFAKITVGISRADAFTHMGIPENVSQVRLGADDIRRILYGDPRMATFDEAEKLRITMSKLCGTTVPLESSKKAFAFASPASISTQKSGYSVWLDFIYVCNSEELTFVQWRGSERIDGSEKSAIWLLFPGISDAKREADKNQ